MSEENKNLTSENQAQASGHGILNMTRRGFLQLSGLVAAAVAGAGIAARRNAPVVNLPPNEIPVQSQYPEVPCPFQLRLVCRCWCRKQKLLQE